ncbi:MAG: NAD-dependent epimerase/dehydratase family protein, partial [Sphingomonas sp.]
MPTSATSPLRFRRLLLTGAAGHLGRELRPRLRARCDRLRLSDRAPIGDLTDGEEFVRVELGDADAVRDLVAGVDAIVHLGGVSTEQPWAPILEANIVGVYHLYEAARRHGVKRIVFASSNHVTGFSRQDEVVGPKDPVRPDGLYGLSKAFGENLAQLYWDRWRIETVSLRIGSAFAEP